MSHPTILGTLLEGFAPDAGPQVLDGRLRSGDRVSVPVKGSDRIVGRVVRASDSKPASHVIVAPEGGGPHVEASAKSARHDTPEQHGREREKRRAELEAQGPPMVPAKGQQPVKPEPGKVVKPGPVRESLLGALLEGFEAAAHPRGWHGRWIGKPGGGKALRVFHGDTHVGDVQPGPFSVEQMIANYRTMHGRSPSPAQITRLNKNSRAHTMIGVGKVVGDAGRTISTGDIATVVDKAKDGPSHDPHGPVNPAHVDPSRHPTPTAGLPPDAAGLMKARERAAAEPVARAALAKGQRPVGGASIMAAAGKAQAERAAILAKSPNAQRELEAYRSAGPGTPEVTASTPNVKAYITGKIDAGSLSNQERAFTLKALKHDAPHVERMAKGGTVAQAAYDRILRQIKELERLSRVQESVPAGMLVALLEARS